jgi:hypothetical protein
MLLYAVECRVLTDPSTPLAPTVPHVDIQGHMASAVSELRERSPGEEFLKRTTLLVDDDRNNIEVALSSGVKAVWLDPRDPDSVLEGLLQV